MFAEHGTIDYRLLASLYALLEERHVTRAAARCGIGQPAMSRNLTRLRALAGDELLIRRDGRYERTLRGDAILASLRELLPRLDAALSGRAFEPRTSTHRFRIACTEGTAIVIVPSLVRRLCGEAPGVALDVVAWTDASLGDLDAGLVDLALVGTAEAKRSFATQPLIDDEFVCVVARRHPFARRRMDLDRYLRFDHAVLDVKGRAQPWIDDVLAARATPRRVGLRTPYALSAVLAVAATEMILTVSRREIEPFGGLPSLRLVAAPPEFAKIEYGMAWHARTSGDGAHRWLRAVVADVAAAVSGAPPVASVRRPAARQS